MMHANFHAFYLIQNRERKSRKGRTDVTSVSAVLETALASRQKVLAITAEIKAETADALLRQVLHSQTL